MKHSMGLQTKYFNYIKNGTKRIELRLYDDKRRQINLGDIITFSETDNENNKFEARVLGILRYATFEDLLRDFDITILAAPEMTKAKLLETLSKFYPIEKQQTLGVVGLRIEPII